MMGLAGWVDRLFTDRWLARKDRIDSMFVRRDRRMLIRQLWWVGGKFLIGMGLVVLATWRTDVAGVWGGLLVVGISLVVGTWPMYNVARAQAYRNGWIEGRQATRASYGEAMLRGLSIDEWIEAEYERDMRVFGP